MFLEPGEHVGELAEEAREVVGAVELGELGDVGAGGEGARAGDDDGPDGRVAVERGEDVVELLQRRPIDGVHAIGPGQRDHRDALSSLEADHVRGIHHTIVRPPLTEIVWPVM